MRGRIMRRLAVYNDVHFVHKMFYILSLTQFSYISFRQKIQQAEEEDKVVQKQKSGLEDHQLFDELYETLKENGEFPGLN